MTNTDQLRARIVELVDERDLRHYPFNASVVQTLGSESAGAKMRRLNDADAAAANVDDSVVAALKTALLLAAEHHVDDFDGRRDLQYVVDALRICPKR